MDNNVTLVCFNCGKKTYGTINRPVQFAFELVKIANEAGLYGVFDIKHSRSLVFCDEKCADNQKLKDGSFRLHAKRQ